MQVRPTTDFAKESLFNIIQNYLNIQEIDVLDLFAGTGNISYEFASRGSHTVTSVDKNISSIHFIRQTAEKLNFKNLSVINSDCFRFLNYTKKKWDIIFADPPYDMENIEEIYRIIFDRSLLNINGQFILEHKKSLDFSNFPGFVEHRNYGAVNFSFFGETGTK